LTSSFLYLLGWLAELIFASWLLSEGSEHLSERWGGRFVGRTLLSVATTLPEIAIVVAAAKNGSYNVAIGSALGSNLFMMTLGLAIMIIIATTRLSKAPTNFINVQEFKMDKVLLAITAVIAAITFVNGYDFIEGILFAGLFAAYLCLAFREMKKEKRPDLLETELHINQEIKKSKKHFSRAMVLFVAGTVGIFLGAEPFVESLQGYGSDVGISVAILAVIISPIAGEMPEKISMIFLARKGSKGVSIALANVLGSKIVNNTLLLSVAIFAVMAYKGFFAKIPGTTLLVDQMILVTVITLVALVPMFRNKLDLRSGVLLLSLYAIGIGIQFVLPHS